jgi:hypothetical protein
MIVPRQEEKLIDKESRDKREQKKVSSHNKSSFMIYICEFNDWLGN